MNQYIEGILPLNKPKDILSFSLISKIRKLTNQKKVGHTGTLDPFATGVVILLIGKQYTKQSNTLLHENKEYEADIYLGVATDTYDCDGKIEKTSPIIPSLERITECLAEFQGNIEQTPPMFSAKKVQGKKLYELARKGIQIYRKPQVITIKTTLMHYHYPYLKLYVHCSKGTYIRSLAHDIGQRLGCGAHLKDLIRTKNGPYTLSQCADASRLFDLDYDWKTFLCT